MNNCILQATVRNVCCGAREGFTQFYRRSGKCDSLARIHPLAGFEKITVSLTTIDLEIEKLDLTPSVIKIDTEGAEFDVLKGAELVLSRYKPKLFLSLHPDVLGELGVTTQEIQDWLAERGYRWNLIDMNYVFAE